MSEDAPVYGKRNSAKEELLKFIFDNGFITKPSLKIKFESLVNNAINEEAKITYGVIKNLDKPALFSLTKLEYFTSLAMQGMAANAYRDITDNNWAETLAKHSMQLAKETLKQLNNG